MNTFILLRRIGWMMTLLGSTSACAAAPDAGYALPLTRVADVPLGGGTTRMDYASFDPRRHLLFIAHLGDNAVIVFDTQTQKVVARISGISQVHGVPEYSVEICPRCPSEMPTSGESGVALHHGQIRC